MAKRRRRRPEQVVKALQEGEAMLAAGKSLADVQQKLEVSEATWMRWKKQYGGMKSDEAKRLRKLELENRRLKEMRAEASLPAFTVRTSISRAHHRRFYSALLIPRISVSNP